MRRLLFALPFLLLASGAWGQHWTQVSSPFGGYQLTTPYFLNANVGFAFNGGIFFNTDLLTPIVHDGSSGLYLSKLERTTNGGLTWTALNFFDTSGYLITQLSFVSLTHGFASVAPNYSFNNGPGSGGIFETFDQGSHWKKITNDGLSFNGVYATKDAIFASEFSNPIIPRTGAILYSRDDGAIWDSITSVAGLTFGAQPQFQFIYGNRDSLVATVCFSYRGCDWGDTYLVFSTDLGRTWNSSLLDHCYPSSMASLHISPHSCSIVRQLGSLGDTYSFLESSPPYVTWNPSLLQTETGAWIAGNSCAMYVSYAGQDTLVGSLYRSTNDGLSWASDGTQHTDGTVPNMDEIDDADWQNISVVGYGAVVYAENSNFFGNLLLWKTTDGGDGTLSAAALAPQLALAHAPFPSGNNTFYASCANEAQMLVTNFNIGCSWATFDSVTIAGLDTSEYSVTSTHYCGCTHVPDTSFITLAPKQTGIRNVTVHFHYTDDEFNQIDTMLAVTLDVKSSGVAVPMSLALGSGTMIAHAGDTIEIPVYLSSDSSITLSGATSIILPFAIDTNVLKVLSFDLAIAGATTGAITYGESTGTVPLQIPDLTIRGKTLIGSLRCVVYLADTLQTSVSLAGASINSAGAGCVALSTQAGAVNIAITGCGDSTLLHFMQAGKIPLGIRSISPNPASGSVAVSFDHPTSAAISFRVFDALGMKRTEGVVTGGGLMLDVRSLPVGLYYLRASDETGAIASGRFIIER